MNKKEGPLLCESSSFYLKQFLFYSSKTCFSNRFLRTSKTLYGNPYSNSNNRYSYSDAC